MPSVVIGADSALVMNRNFGRMSMSVRNASVGGQIIYIDNVTPSGMTVENAGHPLAVGESLNFVLEFDGPDIRGPWSAIASAAGGVLYYKEYAQRSGV